jgi:hypothetical protein
MLDFESHPIRNAGWMSDEAGRKDVLKWEALMPVSETVSSTTSGSKTHRRVFIKERANIYRAASLVVQLNPCIRSSSRESKRCTHCLLAWNIEICSSVCSDP